MVDDSDIPTEKLQEQIDAVREHATEQERAEHEPERHWLDRVAISTALFAVFAAIAALQSGQRESDALLRSNAALYHETVAVDTWAEYQAQGIKAAVETAQASVLTNAHAASADVTRLDQRVKSRTSRQAALMQAARAQEHERDHQSELSARALEHHERFALSVSLFQVAIGLGALAALTKLRAIWLLSLIAGAIALLIFGDGFFLIDTTLLPQAAPTPVP